MALDTETGIAPYDAPEKDLYEVGEMPPVGYVPKQMYAWAIRRERHGEPDTTIRTVGQSSLPFRANASTSSR